MEKHLTHFLRNNLGKRSHKIVNCLIAVTTDQEFTSFINQITLRKESLKLIYFATIYSVKVTLYEQAIILNRSRTAFCPSVQLKVFNHPSPSIENS